MATPEYDHVQRSPMGWMLAIPGLCFLLGAPFVSPREAALTFVFTGGVLVVVGLAFQRLHTYDEGGALAVRFGPLPLFRTRILYRDMASASPDRTRLIDGIGIHYVLGRGWTYNIWGFGCVKVTLRNGKAIRIGTDEPHELASFLNSKLESCDANKPGA